MKASKFGYWLGKKTGPSHGLAIYENGGFVLVDFRSPGATSEVYGASATVVWADVVGVALSGKNGWSCEYEVGKRTYYFPADDLVNPTDVVLEVLERRSKLIAENEAVESDPVKHLERELRCHDWYYMFSDDHSVWSAGCAHWKLLLTLAEKVDAEVAAELWSKHAPDDCKFPKIVEKSREVSNK